MLYITRKFNKSKMIYDVNAWFDNLAELKDDEVTKYLLKSINNAGYVSIHLRNCISREVVTSCIKEMTFVLK